MGATPIASFAAATASPDGREREAAVRRLAGLRDPFAVPFLIARLNDWVPEVRDAAREALVDLLGVPGAPEALVRQLPLLEALERGRRADHAPILAAIAELLTRRSPSSLEAALARDGESLRAIRFTLRHGQPRSALAKTAALRAITLPDPPLRTAGARLLLAAGEAAEIGALLPKLLVDRLTSVRRLALEHAVAQAAADPAVLAFLERAVLDRAPSIREIARFHLAKRRPVDFAAAYREALAVRAKTLEAAVDGLGETGAGDDAERLRPLAEHAHAGVRRAALRAIGRLDRGREAAFDALLLRAIEDPSPAVACVAARLLRPRAFVIGRAPIEHILVETPRPTTRPLVVDLLSGLDRWTALAALLEATAHPDAAASSRARQRLRQWVGDARRSHVAPGPGALAAADASLARSRLDPVERHDLEAAIARWRC